jgi:nucleoside-diphosphate-sugar epimerase
MASDFTFHPVDMGGGLLNDMGPHVFDILRFWFGGQLSVISYGDNSAGGAESEVRIELHSNSVPVEVELSRLRTLDNCCIVKGEWHTIHVGTQRSAEYTQFDPAGNVVSKGPVPILAPARTNLEHIFQEQLVQFNRAISGDDSALPTFEDGAATVRLTQACRIKQRRCLPRPWETSRPAPSYPAERVAVTGATGFIGSHIVERLLTATEASSVVAVARSLPRLTRLSHLLDHSRLRYAHTDILHRESLITAFQGCDVIIHTVCGTTGDQKHRWMVTVEGTAAVLDAAARAGVRRIVNISTMAVYETAGRSILHERCPLLAVASEDLSYAQQKLVAEQLVLEAAGGSIEVVTVQPTIVYGPWGTTWTLKPLHQLRSGNDILPSGPYYGVCNAVHVHDVADAVVFLVGLPITDPLRVLVSGPQPVGWGTFYDTYRDLLGVPRPHRDPQAELSAPAELYASQVVVSTQRLTSLGFNASIGFSEGMAQVAEWARWAGLTAPINRGPTHNAPDRRGGNEISR